MVHEKYPTVRDEEIRGIAPLIAHDSLKRWYADLNGTRAAAQTNWYGLQTYDVTPRRMDSRMKSFTVALSPAGSKYPRVSVRGRKTMRWEGERWKTIEDEQGHAIMFDWDWTRERELAWRRQEPGKLDLVAVGSRLMCMAEPAIATVADAKGLEAPRAEELLLDAASLLVARDVLLLPPRELREPVDLMPAFASPQAA